MYNDIIHNILSIFLLEPKFCSFSKIIHFRLFLFQKNIYLHNSVMSANSWGGEGRGSRSLIVDSAKNEVFDVLPYP